MRRRRNSGIPLEHFWNRHHLISTVNTTAMKFRVRILWLTETLADICLIRMHDAHSFLPLPRFNNNL